MSEVDRMANIEHDAETDRLIEALAIEAQRGLRKAISASFAAGREAGRADARGAVEDRDKLAAYLRWRFAPQEKPAPLPLAEVAAILERLGGQ